MTRTRLRLPGMPATDEGPGDVIRNEVRPSIVDQRTGGARSGRFAPRDPADLREAWSRESLKNGWARPGDWWVPEVDAVVAALAGGRDAVSACGRLGRARADAGVGARESLNDLYALYRQLPGGGPPLIAVRALVEAWTEATVAAIRTATCEDPLSGLASAAYLRTRLTEVYREAERDAAAVADRHVLLVVDLGETGGPAGWEAMLFRLTLGDCLRSTFSGGETLASVGPRAVIGLVNRDQHLARRVETLRTRLGHLRELEGVRVWLERLPLSVHSALDLVACIDGGS